MKKKKKLTKKNPSPWTWVQKEVGEIVATAPPREKRNAMKNREKGALEGKKRKKQKSKACEPEGKKDKDRGCSRALKRQPEKKETMAKSAAEKRFKGSEWPKKKWISRR